MAFDFSKYKSNLEQVLELVGDDLNSIKTGRAKPSMVEDVMIEAYGTKMPLKELASISAPDPHMITVSPWDQSVLGAIERGLASGQNQFNPAVDGSMIRIVIAQLTGEKREEMIKMVAQKIESGKQMIRSARTDAKKDVEAQKGMDDVSEDDIDHDLGELDKITSEYVDRLEEMGKNKDEELRTI